MDMIYAKKKVQNNANLAAQRAQVIANVNELMARNLLKIVEDEVYVYPEIWKDKASALNWIKCLHLYFMLKRRFKERDILNFKHYESGEMIASFKNKKPALYLEFPIS